MLSWASAMYSSGVLFVPQADETNTRNSKTRSLPSLFFKSTLRYIDEAGRLSTHKDPRTVVIKVEAASFPAIYLIPSFCATPSRRCAVRGVTCSVQGRSWSDTEETFGILYGRLQKSVGILNSAVLHMGATQIN